MTCIDDRISVCLAYFKGKKYVTDQIASILSQLGKHDELIVSVDGLIDFDFTVFRDERIFVVQNDGKAGVYNNFEFALKNAKHNIIFLSDQDDIWLPNKLNLFIDRLQNYDFVFSDAFFGDDLGVPTEIKYSDIRFPYKSFVGNFYKMSHLGCCMAFRKSSMQQLLPFPKSLNLLTHDMWILLYGLLFTSHTYIDQPTLIYRRHDTNVSDGGVKSQKKLSYKILVRLYISICLLRRWFRNFFRFIG